MSRVPRPRPHRPRQAYARLWPLVALVVLLAPLVLVPGPVAAQATPPTAHLYLVPSTDTGRLTLFDREPVVQGNATIERWVPASAERVDVLLPGGAPALWTRVSADRLAVYVPANASHVDVVSHDLPFVAAAPRLDLAGRPLEARLMVHAVVADGQRLDVLGPPEPALFDPDPSERGLPAMWPMPHAGDLQHRGPYEEAVAAVRIAKVDAPEPLSTATLAGITLAVLTALTVVLFARVHATLDDPTRTRAMPILGHLEELRRRFFVVLGTLVFGAAFFFTFGFRVIELRGVPLPVPVPSLYGNTAAQVFGWLALRVVPEGVTVVVTNPWDAVVTQITLAIALGVALTFPVLFYQAYAYLAPGLYPSERRAVLGSVPVVVALFVLGAAFGIGWMMPFTIRILYGFAGTLYATTFLNVSDLVGLATALGLVFGLAFQLPMVMMLTARLGLVSWRTYADKWRHATVAIFVVAAMVTDPTVITQLVVAAVLGLLYAVGVLLAFVAGRRHAATQPDGATGTGA